MRKPTQYTTRRRENVLDVVGALVGAVVGAVVVGAAVGGVRNEERAGVSIVFHIVDENTS